MLGPETAKHHQTRIHSEFYRRFMRGKGLDIGYKGEYGDEAEPVLNAIGVDTDYPGYDGLHLPFDDESQDYVFASHVLEHVDDRLSAIKEWFRVLRVGAHLVICVPHRDLYEKKWELPSKWNGDHKMFYTPERLIAQIELALFTPNTWRLRHMRDNDDNYLYGMNPNVHAVGGYEIECVIQKIQKPKWSLE